MTFTVGISGCCCYQLFVFFIALMSTFWNNSLLCRTVLKEHLRAKRKNELIHLRMCGGSTGTLWKAEGRWGHSGAPVGCALEPPLLLQPSRSSLLPSEWWGQRSWGWQTQCSWRDYCCFVHCYLQGPGQVRNTSLLVDWFEMLESRCHDQRRTFCFVSKRHMQLSLTLNWMDFSGSFCFPDLTHQFHSGTRGVLGSSLNRANVLWPPRGRLPGPALSPSTTFSCSGFSAQPNPTLRERSHVTTSSTWTPSLGWRAERLDIHM